MKIDSGWWIRNSRRELAFACQTLLLALLVPLAVRAQQDTIPQRGFFAAGSYALSDLETINTANGNVIFRIPLVSLPPGRGGTPGPTVNLYYNSKLWDTFVWVQPDPRVLQDRNEVVPSPDGGWRYAFKYELRLDKRLDHFSNPTVSCTTPGSDNIYKLEMSFPDGSVREFRPRGFSDFYGDGYFKVTPDGYFTCGGGVTSAITYYSTDASYLKLVIDHDTDSNWMNNPWTLYFPDGGRVTGGNAPQRIYDRNNNFVEFRNITYNTHPATQVVDQLGRSLIIEYGSAPGQDSVYAWGANNEQMQWTVRWTSASVSKLYFPDDSESFTWTLAPTLRVIDQVSLPAQAGTLTYAFNYNPGAASPGWGELSLFRLPSDAQVTYPQATYQYRNDGLNPLRWSAVIDNIPTRKDLTYLREYDGTSTPTTEPWVYSQGSGSGYKSFSITQPDGGVLTDYISSNYFGLPNYKTEHPDGRVVERLWDRNLPFGVASAPNLAANPYVKTEFTSLKDSLGNPVKTAIKDFSYDKNGNLTRLAEYDWVAWGAVPRDGLGNPTGIPAGVQPKRITVHTYYNPTPDASCTDASCTCTDGSCGWDDGDAYYHSSSRALRNARQYSEVRDGADQALSRAEFFYDNAATTGNLTQEKRWDSTKGALTRPLTASNLISVSHEYSPSGNRTLTTDARSVKTQFVYGSINCPSGQFSDLHVTQTNAAYQTTIKRTTNFEYDCNTGRVTSQTDADNNVTTNTSYDVFGRPTLVQEDYRTPTPSPIERRTATEYSDTARRVIVRRDLSATDDRRLVTVEHYDQLGRIRLRRQIENTATEVVTEETTGIKVQTRYLQSSPNSYQLVSNPYRAAKSSDAGLEETMGWTRTKFDSGGRVVEVQTFSGASLPSPWGTNSNSTGSVTTSYDSNTTTVTDQTGKARRGVTDGLGRLSQLIEDPAGLAHSTTYSYDALDSLKTVQQGGQTRTFVYDSLARLTSATNPENGTIEYPLYDGNGNLLQKRDARGTITYSYDALNRLYSRSYTDGTPLVTFVYDAAGVAYSKGRLTSVGSTVSSYGYDEYDALGRVKRSSQVTDGRQYLMSYVYNLADGMTSQTYPSGRTVSTSFDTAGRISGVTGQKSGELNKTYVWSSISYASHGAVKAMQLGNLKWEHTNFNSRLQPTQIGLGTTSTSTSVMGLDYNYGATTNNGNVWSQTITRPAFTKTQNYGVLNGSNRVYDNLNRLQQAEEVGSWSQTYGHDQFGNHWVTAGSYVPDPVLTPQSQSAFNAANNRLVASQYDTAGNQIQDARGRTFTYDLESRQKTFNGTTATYSYDGEGRRVMKGEAGGTTIFVYNASGVPVADYSELPPSETSGTSYVTADHLGSTRVVTDTGGATKKCYDYFPFGEQIPSSVGGRSSLTCYAAADTLRQKFTGKERDGETGLDYFGARYMSAAQGRFTSPDVPLIDQHPKDPQSWNLYAYVRNNPLVLIDPTGLGCVYANSSGNGIGSIDNDIGSGECASTGGTWVPGTINQNHAVYNKKTGLFQVASNDGTNVYYATFGAGTTTAEDGSCVNGCMGAEIQSANAAWLSSMIVGGTLDQAMSFMVGRDGPIHGVLLGNSAIGRIGEQMISGPLDFWNDRWAGPAGMGPPQGRGDWSAMLHDYNFDTNRITIGTYFNPTISKATAKALIQSNRNLIRNAGGVQGVKMGIFFGVVNVFQWAAHLGR